ncbi:BBE domain-containing protein [Streptomyces sp. SD15]
MRPHGSEAKHQRLRAVKAAWDPDNLLRFNKNIAPATAGCPPPPWCTDGCLHPDVSVPTNPQVGSPEVLFRPDQWEGGALRWSCSGARGTVTSAQAVARAGDAPRGAPTFR